MKWEWLGSEDPEVLKGRMTLEFSAGVIDIPLPNSGLAHLLGRLIQQELDQAHEAGRRELSDGILKALENAPK